jgi:carboxypeptidase T
MGTASKVLWAVVLAAFLGPLGALSAGNAVGPGAPVEPSAAPAPSPEAAPLPVANAGVTIYHTWGEMVAEITQMAVDHANIVKLISIGKTWQGRDIWALKISDNPEVEEDEPEVYFNANHHAREWMTIEITLNIANFLTNNYGTNTTVTNIVNNRQVWIVPSANPDGRVYDGALLGDDPTAHARAAQSGWRKNARDNAVPGFDEASDGVDLNRNYGYMWGVAGACSDYADDTYCGPSAFSEPEPAAIRDFCRQHDFVFAISYHTSSQLILYPEGWNFGPNRDTVLLQNVAKGMQARITNTAGSAQPYYTPEQSSSLYATSGSDDDWLWGELGVLAYCIEAYPSGSDSGDPAIAAPYDSFHPRADKVPLVCADNLGAALWLCQIADNPYQAMDHVSLKPTVNPVRVLRGTSGNDVINVTDDGRRADSFNLVRTTPSGWTTSLTPGSLSLARNQTLPTTLGITVPAGATPGTYKIWVNATSTSNASCTGSCVVNVEVPWTNDVGVISQSPFAEQGTYPRGIYRISGTVKNFGDGASPGFNSYCNITRGSTLATQALFTDNMESGTGPWTTIDYDGTMSTNYWHQVTTSSHSTTHSWYCGPTTPGNYANNVVQAIQMAQPISLRTATGANITYWTSYNLENAYDYLTVYGSRNNGQTWEYVTRYTGTATAWTQRTTNLGAFAGASQFKIRFMFTADGGTVSTGPYFDDVTIAVQIPAETTVYGPTAQATPALAAQGTAVVNWTYNFNQGGMYRVSTWTALGTDGYAANNITSVIIRINASRAIPEFAGVSSVTNLGDGSTLAISWPAALDINGGVTYRLVRFTAPPTPADITAAMNGTYLYDGTAQNFYDMGRTAGTTYYYVVRAHDSLGNWEYNTVYKSAAPETLLFFQIQTAFGAYRNLNNDPFEASTQVSLSPSLGTVGQHKVADAWITQQYPTAQDANGLWKFRVNGRADYASAHGYLYARVYRYNGGAPVQLFQTADDDEDVASYWGAYHEFYWEHTPSGASLPANDRFYVELWLDVTSLASGNSSATYTYAGTTQAGGPHDAWFCDNDDGSDFELTTPNSVAEFSDLYYTNAASSNDVRAGPSVAPGTGDEVFTKFRMAVSENPSTLTSIQFTYEARHSAANGICTLYALNQTSQAWDPVGTTMTFAAANTDYTMTRTLSSFARNYVAGGALMWGVYESVSNLQVSVDFAQAVLNYNLPTAVFTFGYDSSATPSSVHPYLTAGGGPVQCDVAVNATGWNLVSLPIRNTAGAGIAWLFTDQVAPLVTWDRIMWYNPRTSGDPWKQYSKNWPGALNDLTSYNTTMGVWLNVTSVGDGIITKSGLNWTADPSTAVPVKAGWNLIGFPSDDAAYPVGNLKSDCMVITMVQGFMPSATYRVTNNLADSQLLAQGRAYWVFCTGDGSWTKTW